MSGAPRRAQRPLRLRAAAAFAAIAAALVAASAAAAAEKARLRAADLADRSRILIDLPELGVWQLASSGRKLVVRFPGRALEFDVSAVYPERRASRVLSARGASAGGDATLELGLACDCVAAAYPAGPGRLVIDLTDGPEPRAEAEPAPAEPARQPAAQEAKRAATAAAPRAAPPPRMRAEATATAAADQAPAAEGSRDAPPPGATPRLAVAAAPAAEAGPPAAETIAAARLRLMEQLARAAEQGLIEMREPFPAEPPSSAPPTLEGATETPLAEAPPPPDAPAPDPVAEAPAASGAGPAAPPSPAIETSAASATGEGLLAESGAPIHIRSAFEAVAEAPELPSGPPKSACIDDRALEVASWARSGPMAPQIARLRRELLAEFDRPNPEAALALARLYVHFGFGAEAAAEVRAFAADPPEAALLADLGRIVDGAAPEADGPLARAAGCGGRARMWRAAAGLEPPGPAGEEGRASAEEIAGAFAELPIGLRRVLGPRLIGWLLDAGQTGAAGRIQLLVQRAPGDHGPQYRLAFARLAGAQGDFATAEAGYRALVAANAAEAPQALIELTESLLSRGAAPNPGLAEDLAAMAFAHAGSPIGARLRLAEIRARAGSLGLDAALSLIADDMAASGEPEAQRRLAREILEAATAEEQGAAAYARAALAHVGLLGEAPAADAARIAMGGELTGIGLANAAVRVLAPPLSRGHPEAALVAADAYLALARPATALAALEGIDGAAATRLRAEALARRGDHAAALAALGDAAAPALRGRLAWSAGLWPEAARNAAGPRAVMAAYMAGERAAPVPAAAEEDAAADGSAAEAPPPERAFLAPMEIDEPVTLASAKRLVGLARGARGLMRAALGGG